MANGKYMFWNQYQERLCNIGSIWLWNCHFAKWETYFTCVFIKQLQIHNWNVNEDKRQWKTGEYLPNIPNWYLIIASMSVFNDAHGIFLFIYIYVCVHVHAHKCSRRKHFILVFLEALGTLWWVLA